MVGVQGTHKPPCLRILLVQQRVEEPAVGGEHAVPGAFPGDHVRGVIGDPALVVTGDRATPVCLGVFHTAVTFNNPRFPLRIKGLPFPIAELGFPGEIIGENGIVFRQPVKFNEFTQAVARQVHGGTRPQRQVRLQAQGIHAPQQVQQILGLHRFPVNKNTQRITPQRNAAFQVTLDNVGMVRLGADPVFKIVLPFRANARRGHVVHAMRPPPPAFQHEIAVLHGHVRGVRFGLPAIESMFRPVQHYVPAIQERRNRTAFVRPGIRRPGPLKSHGRSPRESQFRPGHRLDCCPIRRFNLHP
ncbi:MAG: hypothetical protein BWX80_01543 [Candidatus Hydrogenedentes bacterium ADurb.Bin101]|nr:MAG: hypothetical protein BWX80_01543 [Candidatus Hydrogenedentes bacterium ADurb.Bin101]